MSALDRALEQCSEEIEADLARWHPAARLADLRGPCWRPGMLTHRRLGVLLRHLPGDSAYRTWVRDNVPVPEPTSDEPDFTGQPWSLINYQLLSIRDAIIATVADEDFKPSPMPQQKRAEVEQTVPRNILSEAEKLEMLARVRANRGWE